jgi:xanthine dehydrogenase small subunit/xanthine dehydrogenase large subunit
MTTPTAAAPPPPSADALCFTLNGAIERPTDWTPTTTLLAYLRATGRTGSKEGCAEGDCGACAVALADSSAEGPIFRATNSCIVLLGSLHGRAVLTVEGLTQAGEAAHPAQTAMVAALGSQCGYCTPGFVMSLFEATYRPALAAPGWRREDQLAGNLCRCTGYRPIREALDAVAGARPADRFAAALSTPAPAAALHVVRGGERFDQPATLDEALALRAADPEARVVAGATDLGLEVTLKGRRWPALLSLEAIAALRGATVEGDQLVIGATTRLADLEDAAEHTIPALHRMLRYFGARAIKGRGTLGGNLCTASPIGDLGPVMLALGADLIAARVGGTRAIAADDFWTGYRSTALAPDELLTHIRVPLPGPRAHQAAYKVSRRRELDISTVSAAFHVELDADGRVRVARLAYGGMGPRPLRARGAEDALLGAAFDEASVRAAAAALEAELRPLSDHRGSASYRMRVAKNLLLGFLLERQKEGLRAGAAALGPRHTGTLALDAAPGASA